MQNFLKNSHIHSNLSPSELIQKTLELQQGILSDTGALVVDTGIFTGRSPKDRFIVCDSKTEHRIWWGDINIKFSPEKFDRLFNRIAEYLKNKDIYIRDAFVCADPLYTQTLP